jgi:hypothetical protein
VAAWFHRRAQGSSLRHLLRFELYFQGGCCIEAGNAKVFPMSLQAFI